MVHCYECKYWDQEESGKLKSCDNKKWRTGYSLTDEDVAEDEILVESDEGWAFYTGPKFGCIHGEEKDH